MLFLISFVGANLYVYTLRQTFKRPIAYNIYTHLHSLDEAIKYLYSTAYNILSIRFKIT